MIIMMNFLLVRKQSIRYIKQVLLFGYMLLLDGCIGDNSDTAFFTLNYYLVSFYTKYKNIYNRILDIKKLFESLDIGTIISPDNERNILTEGWKLRFFDDIRGFDREL